MYAATKNGARSSADESSRVRERKNDNSCGLTTLKSVANDSSFGLLRNWSAAKNSREVLSVAIVWSIIGGRHFGYVPVKALEAPKNVLALRLYFVGEANFPSVTGC